MSGLRAVGDTNVLVLADDLTRTQIVQYAGASGDYNPLHTDEVYATQIGGYPSTFAHGMLVMGMAARVVTEQIDPDDLVEYSARFTRVVWPGDRLRAHAEVESVRAVDAGTLVSIVISVMNGRGEQVLAGRAIVRHAGGADE